MFFKMIKLNTFIKIIFLLFILLQNSCGIKKSWEETGRYTVDDSATSTYVWKKGKQYIALVSTIPIPGRYIKNTIHPIRISPSTIQSSFSKVKKRPFLRFFAFFRCFLSKSNPNDLRLQGIIDEFPSPVISSGAYIV